MNLSPILKALADKGATIEMLIAATEAFELQQEEALSAKRAKDAERQQRHRMSRDVTVTNVTKETSSPSDGFPHPSLTSPSKENPPKGGQKKVSPAGKRLIEFLQETLKGQHTPQQVAQAPDCYIPDDFAEAWETKFPGMEERLMAEWEKFTRYFTSADCKKPVKKDWKAAWLNWITK